jgi:hypothetical protein
MMSKLCDSQWLSLSLNADREVAPEGASVPNKSSIGVENAGVDAPSTLGWYNHEFHPPYADL